MFSKVDGRKSNFALFDPVQSGYPIKNNMKTGDPAKYRDSRLQSLWNELPNQMNKAFIGLDIKVNGVKACIFNDQCQHLQEIESGTDVFSVNRNLNLWNDM